MQLGHMSLAELISNKPTGRIQRPYIIAEIGVNHEGSMDTAKRLIEEAKKGEADAVKFQTYKAEKLASKESPAYWDTTKESTKSQYELFKKHDKFWKDEFVQLKDIADQFDIEFLSTPFDTESADFLNDLMEVYKVSSSDLSNFPFIEYLCRKGKPILLSAGASYMWEVHEVVELIAHYKNPLSLMHCVLNYPTLDKNAHLGMIPDMRLHFPDLTIGYSDHTLPGGMDNLVTATLLGAQIIEKHFTHDKSLPGNDHYHAMDYKDLIVFNKRIAHTIETLGSFSKTCLPSEIVSRENARRSLVASRTIKEGKKIEMNDLTWKRPASGIGPKHYKSLLGKHAARLIKEDEVLQWQMFTDGKK